MSLTARSVVFALSGFAEIVIAKGSATMSFLGIPYSAARATIFSAIRSRSSAVSGIPRSSSVRATITPPYFAAIGRTDLRLSSFPFTEFIIAFPL